MNAGGQPLRPTESATAASKRRGFLAQTKSCAQPRRTSARGSLLTAPVGLWKGLVFALLTAVCVPSAAQATSLYTCTTADGRVLSSDRIIPECLDREQRELRPDGSVRRVIPPQLVGAAREQAEAEARAREAEERARLDQLRRDRALLQIYNSEEDIEAARQRSLRIPREIMDSAMERIQAFEASIGQLSAVEASSSGQTGATEVETRDRELADLEQSIANERSLILRQESEMARINARFDADLARFREIAQR